MGRPAQGGVRTSAGTLKRSGFIAADHGARGRDDVLELITRRLFAPLAGRDRP
jgi:hypothetical protein